jgi:hypothetical protein
MAVSSSCDDRMANSIVDSHESGNHGRAVVDKLGLGTARLEDGNAPEGIGLSKAHEGARSETGPSECMKLCGSNDPQALVLTQKQAAARCA